MSVYPDLDVKRMLRPILRNYNRHVLRFVRILQSLSCELSYEGPRDFREHARDKLVYACSIRVHPIASSEESGRVPSKKKTKILKNAFPVMIGSNLDHCVRKLGLETLAERDLISVDFLDEVDNGEFCPADIAPSFFMINGCARQLPYFFTNDPTNAHVVRGRNLVRCYTYDSDDRGKEMNYFAERDEKGNYERGDVEVVLNDGTSVKNSERNFFDHCSYRTAQAAYMDKVFRDGQFDIDHLANKVVVSPGHLFVKLFVKYLYRPLKIRDWPAIKTKHVTVLRSIETGTLLHVLSKKTDYFKDPPSTMTVVNPTSGSYSGGRRSSSNATTKTASGRGCNGDSTANNGSDVYVEKNTGCYREVTMQTYPLNPYLSHLITRQTSTKVANANIVAFHPSYSGFLCVVGTFETKHIGRTGVMVRETAISIREDVLGVYEFLRLEEEEVAPKFKMRNNKRRKTESFYAVVNEACVPVSQACFERVCSSLGKLKIRFKYIECYCDDNFVLIRYKTGLFFKKLYYRIDEFADEVVWVTARDEDYWKRHHRDRLRPTSFNQVTSFLRDLNPFFNHNVFTKNILAYNTLKSAILSTDPRFSEYFMETLSAYVPLSPHHRIVSRPVDSFSARFTLRVPLLTVAYASFKGLNQEDCVVVHRDVRAFDCFRFHTVRLKFDTPSRYVSFHPTRGDPDAECFLLGNLVCHDVSLPEFRVSPQTMHARLELVRGGEGRRHHHYKVYFNKSEFAIRSYTLTESRLVVCLERFHKSQTGDKLSSFHGQKGVVRTVDSMPVFGRIRDAFGNIVTATVHMLVNPYCLFRMTLGQVKEALFREGRDFALLWNSDGKRVTAQSMFGIFVGPTFYFGVNYLSREHIHFPIFCTLDTITNQPLRGRSRNGGMRMGNMETLNGMRGNGLSGCFEEKALEHSDRIFDRVRVRLINSGIKNILNFKWKNENHDFTAAVAKSFHLCKQDMSFYKIIVNVYVKPYFEEEKMES